MDVSCQCGHARFSLTAEPRLRFICHCTLCQRFNGAPQADIAIFRRDEVALTDPSTVEFKRYKSPPAVDRGRCRACDQPFVEYLTLPLLPSLAFVPVAVLEGVMTLPEPAMRLFYDKRVQDADDDLPRFSGVFASQLAATRQILPALRR